MKHTALQEGMFCCSREVSSSAPSASALWLILSPKYSDSEGHKSRVSTLGCIKPHAESPRAGRDDEWRLSCHGGTLGFRGGRLLLRHVPSRAPTVAACRHRNIRRCIYVHHSSFCFWYIPSSLMLWNVLGSWSNVIGRYSNYLISQCWRACNLVLQYNTKV